MADPLGQYREISSLYLTAPRPNERYVHIASLLECGRSDTDISSKWANELFLPAYLAVFSAIVLFSRGILSTGVVQDLSQSEDEVEDIVVEPDVSPINGIICDIKTHVQSMGGPIIFSYKILRLLGCLVLVVLSIATDGEERGASKGSEVARKKHKGRKKTTGKSGFTDAEWLQVALSLTYVSVTSSWYCSTLAHEIYA